MSVGVSFIALLGMYATADARKVWAHARLAPLATLFAPNDAALRFEIGNYYFGGLPGQGSAYDLQKAKKYYEQALEIDPNMQGPHYQLARNGYSQARLLTVHTASVYNGQYEKQHISASQYQPAKQNTRAR